MWFALSLTPALVFIALSLGPWRAWLPPDSSAEGQVTGKKSVVAMIAALGAGAVVAIPVELGVGVLGRWFGVDAKAQVTGALASMLATLLVFAPLEEAAKAGAAWPFRSRYLHEGRQGALLGAAVAVGFACVEVALYFTREKSSIPGALAMSRAGLAVVARALTGAAWGYALATLPHKRYPDKRFWLTWCAVTVLRGLHDHLVFGKGLAALLASMPLLAGMVMVAYVAARQIAPVPPLGSASGRLSFLPSLPPPPSFRAMRDALRRAERPVMLHWIVLGTLVTMGVVISCVVGAVVAGRRAGVDFGAVDEGQVTGAVPLALVGAAVLWAFLVSGYLVARASGAVSVLEPAFAAALAIVAALVLLGLAAPVAVVFALAFAPIAFGLACAGAWVGIGAVASGPLPPRRPRR